MIHGNFSEILEQSHTVNADCSHFIDGELQKVHFLKAK